MKMFKAAAAIATFAAVAASAPAAAVVTPFATFSAPGTALNIDYVNTANSPTRLYDANIFTTSTAKSNIAGATVVRFSFQQSAFVTQPAIQNVSAAFTLNATVAKNTPTTVFAPANPTSIFDQAGIAGSFSFKTLTAITVTGPNFITHTYAAGSNLLSGTFMAADLSGKIKGSSGSLDASTEGGSTLVFTSDFLDFLPTIERDFSLSLVSVDPTFAKGTAANKSLKNFRASVGGSFSSDPAPIINGLAIVPEPAVWGLLVVGFGMVGAQTRRRMRSATVSA